MQGAQPRRICFIGPDNHNVLVPQTESVFVGGESVQQVLLARAFRDSGFEVSMIVKAYSEAKDSSIEGIRVVQAFDAVDPISGVRSKAYLKSRFSGLYSAMRLVDADIYYQSPAGAFTGIASLFCKYYGKSFIFRVASDANCIPGEQLIRSWKNRKVYEYGLRHADLVAVQSEKQQDLLHNHYGVSGEIINMIVESPISQEAPVKDIDVLWVNNHREVKRPGWVLEIAKMLPQFKFVMVGGPNPGWESEYQLRSSQAVGIKNMNFVGPVPYGEVNEYFDRASLFLNTSYVEGFPNSFLQAWIRGIPVVSSFDPDQVIANQSLGAHASNIHQLSDALNALLSDQEERSKLSRNCRRFAEKYSMSAVADRYIQLLDDGDRRSV